MPNIKTLLVLVAAILASACGSQNSDIDLSTTRWTLTAFTIDGHTQDVVIDENTVRTPYIWFDDQGEVAGSAGCNNFQNMSAPGYEVHNRDGSSLVLTLNDVAKNAMLCESDDREFDVMAAEDAFTDYLWSEDIEVSVTTDGDVLTMVWQHPDTSAASLTFRGVART